MRNLLDNAQRHAERRVAVSLSSDGKEAVVGVSDDGPGVPEDERSRIFDRFVRLDESRARDTGGAGLGLAVVKAIAAEHGGTVSVSASDLGGAAFEVVLPVS